VPLDQESIKSEPRRRPRWLAMLINGLLAAFGMAIIVTVFGGYWRSIPPAIRSSQPTTHNQQPTTNP
jgi:hypothetical protein